MLLQNAAQNNPFFIKIAQYAAPTPPNTPFLSLFPLQGGGRSGRVGRVRGSDLTLLAIFLDPSLPSWLKTRRSLYAGHTLIHAVLSCLFLVLLVV